MFQITNLRCLNRFIYVETAFFWHWWTRQTEERQQDVKKLVADGQLEFIGGAWSMNDEAVTNYMSIIDQFTWGLRYAYTYLDITYMLFFYFFC